MTGHCNGFETKVKLSPSKMVTQPLALVWGQGAQNELPVDQPIRSNPLTKLLP
jgi:hypothetical protein